MQNDIKELEQTIEGLLFISGQPVEIAEIVEKLEVKEKQVNNAIESLKEKYADRGINIITFKNKVTLLKSKICRWYCFSFKSN